MRRLGAARRAAWSTGATRYQEDGWPGGVAAGGRAGAGESRLETAPRYPLRVLLPYRLALAAAVALAPLAPVAPDPDLVRERALAAGVSDEEARDVVRSLVALGPRMGGTASGAAAAEWLAERFAALGLAVEVVDDEPLWCHSESAWSLAAHVAEEERPVPLASAWPYGFSPSAAGRVPLALEPADGDAWLDARQTRPPRGAPRPAVVLVDGASTPDGRYPRLRSLRAGDSATAPVFGLGRLDGERLRGWLAEGRSVEIEYALEATIARASPRTVVARLTARAGAPPGHLLFCAHGDSDSGGPGANDNASGEAVVLAIAGAWASAVADGTLPAPAREVRFAVWGSEIHSTRDYLERHAAGDDPVLAVINYDQAGFGSGAEQLNVEPDDLPANRALVRLAAEVLADHAGEPGFPARWATNKSLGGTDSYVFSGSPVFRREGRPAVTLFTSAWDEPAEHPRTPDMPGESWSDRDLVRVDHDDYYHSAGDTPENTTDREPHNMGWCARVGLLLGVRWLERLE